MASAVTPTAAGRSPQRTRNTGRIVQTHLCLPARALLAWFFGSLRPRGVKQPACGHRVSRGAPVLAYSTDQDEYTQRLPRAHSYSKEGVLGTSQAGPVF